MKGLGENDPTTPFVGAPCLLGSKQLVALT